MYGFLTSKTLLKKMKRETQQLKSEKEEIQKMSCQDWN
jgi:hypothetical protein